MVGGTGFHVTRMAGIGRARGGGDSRARHTTLTAHGSFHMSRLAVRRCPGGSTEQAGSHEAEAAHARRQNPDRPVARPSPGAAARNGAVRGPGLQRHDVLPGTRISGTHVSTLPGCGDRDLNYSFRCVKASEPSLRSGGAVARCGPGPPVSLDRRGRCVDVKWCLPFGLSANVTVASRHRVPVPRIGALRADDRFGIELCPAHR
jgi:hypothetical protein